MNRIVRIIIVLIVIIAISVGYVLYRKHKNKPEWRLGNLTMGTIREEVTASGTLNPSSEVEVGTEISGKIIKLYKDFNDNVRKGDLLAKLDTQNLETSLEAAQSSVIKAQFNADDAKTDFDLQKELHKNDMGTSYDLQKAQIKYEQALQDLANSKSNLKKAETNLQYAIITSPIDGVVVSRNVEEGQTVAASMSSPTLFIIANDLSKMQISADVDEADIGKIRIGLPVEFTVDAFADEQFKGIVKQIRLNPSTTNNVVTYSVIINVQNPELKLLPGMTANVTIIVQQRDNILRIPDSALRFKPSKELWKQFGLKWNSSNYNNMKNSTPGAGGARLVNANDNQANVPRDNNHNKPGSQKPVSDSIHSKINKMSPEHRQAFRNRFQDNKQPIKQTVQKNETNQFSYVTSESRTVRQTPNRIWILVDGKPVAVEVITGLDDGSFSEVISGLDESQQVITGVNYSSASQATAANRSAFQGGGGFRRH